MIIDFHTHGKLSKKSEFSIEHFRSALDEARLNELNAIALTEHFNTTNFSDMYDQLDRNFDCNDHYYMAEGIKIFPGLEVDVKPSGHILLIGTRSTILDLHKMLEPHASKDAFLSLDALLDLTDPLPLLRIGAHPYRDSNSLASYSPDQLGRLDALDLNAKDLYTYGISMRERVNQLAKVAGIPVVAGSDTHQEMQFGSVTNRLAVDCGSIEELKACIRSRSYSIEISPSLRIKVKAAVTIKKLIKQQTSKE